jgi:hypothetical protein
VGIRRDVTAFRRAPEMPALVERDEAGRLAQELYHASREAVGCRGCL